MNCITFREDIPSWDSYFMGLAKFASSRSKDPKTQVGACIVNKRHEVLSLGYNGMPFGIPDDDEHWSDEVKHDFVVHAEQNAINIYKGDLLWKILYVTLFPCHKCAQIIIQSGICEIVYEKMKKSSSIKYDSSLKLLKEAGIKVRQYEPVEKSITIKI